MPVTTRTEWPGLDQSATASLMSAPVSSLAPPRERPACAPHQSQRLPGFQVAASGFPTRTLPSSPLGSFPTPPPHPSLCQQASDRG